MKPFSSAIRLAGSLEALRVSFLRGRGAVVKCGCLANAAEAEKRLREWPDVKEADVTKGVKESMIDTRTRPSLTLPLWRTAGYFLGAASTALGRDSMTGAVMEGLIRNAYNDSLRTLIQTGSDDPASGANENGEEMGRASDDGLSDVKELLKAQRDLSVVPEGGHGEEASPGQLMQAQAAMRLACTVTSKV